MDAKQLFYVDPNFFEEILFEKFKNADVLNLGFVSKNDLISKGISLDAAIFIMNKRKEIDYQQFRKRIIKIINLKKY